MVLSFLLSIAVDLTVYSVKATYSFGKYLLYGHEITTDEKVTQLERDLAEIREELRKMSHVVDIPVEESLDDIIQ